MIFANLIIYTYVRYLAMSYDEAEFFVLTLKYSTIFRDPPVF